MKTILKLIQISLLGALLVLPATVQAQFQWSERIAGIADWPEDEPDIGLALDTNDNCYVTGWFDGTNDFGGITLTNQSVGGEDIFVAKYNATGALQWVQRAGGTSINYGRGIGVDTNGNVYATGGYSGSAKFGGINLPAPSGEEFFLAKYNNSGAVQWVKSSTGGSDNVYGIGQTVDGAGNSYALVVVDDLSGDATSVTFGSTTVPIPDGSGGPVTILVKYDRNGVAQWAQLMGGSDEVYATKLAVDAIGNVYVHGTFFSTLTIGNSTLTVSTNSSQNMFIAKFDNSGALTWVQQPQGTSGEGGVAVDQAENVYVTGAFDSNLDFGGGISLTNAAPDALFGDAFVAKYNSSGAIQWAQPAGGTSGGLYWDIALDAKTNVYAAGYLGSDAAIAKYNSAGTLQWTESASGPSASPVASLVSKCAVDPTGNCYLTGFYQGTNTFGTNTLQPQETWNMFLAELPSNTVANPTIQFTASPTSGAPPLTVQFGSPSVDSFGSNVLSWNWNFGDGATSAAQNPSHTYTSVGNFFPILVATNSVGGRVAATGPHIMVNPPFTSLYNFTQDYNQTNSDGSSPNGGLILSGNTLYGTTVFGGLGDGTVFGVNTDGTGFTNLHNFNGNDGFIPAGLILSGNTLYGTAVLGGSSGDGTVYAVNTDGTGFTNLYNFTGGNDGGFPVAGLILWGNTLYGTASNGGSAGNGTVYAVNTDGSHFTNLYNFTGGNDGANPQSGLILSGNTLYGTAYNGGSADDGTVYAVNTDGSHFTNLYNFTGGNDGANPQSGLILSGNTLYGTAPNGGSADDGTVYAVNTDGSHFTNLYNFTGGNDGANPQAGLILSGNTLYGTAPNGGSADDGTVYAVNTDGSHFTNLYNFTGGNDGANPQAGLILSGNTLYGTAPNGGSAGNGTVFSLMVNVAVPLPPVILSAPQLSSGKTNFTFLLSGPAGSNYVLQASTNLFNWSPVSTSTIPVSGTITVSNTMSGFNRFYRVEIP